MYKCSLARHPWSLQRSQIHTGLVQHNHFITFAFIQVFFTLSHLHHVHSFSTVHQIHSWYKMPTFFHDNHNRDLRPLSFFIITLLFSDETPLVVENEPGLPPSWCPQQFQRSDWESVFFFLRDHDCFPRDRFVPGGGPLCVRGLPLRPQPDAGAGCRDAWKQGDTISISITNLLHIRRISFVWATSTSTLSPSMC